MNTLDGSLTITYGGVPATARFEGDRDTLSVSLLHDPGTGSMFYSRISPRTVTITGGDPAVIRRAAESYADGIRWVTLPGGQATVDRYAAERDRLRALANELDTP